VRKIAKWRFVVSDGLSDWYKLQRLRELEDKKNQGEIEGTQDSEQDSSHKTVYLWHEAPPEDSHLENRIYEPPVFEQMWDILSADAQAKIRSRFQLCLVSLVSFWLGVWMAHQ